jgi:hypothetical protein
MAITNNDVPTVVPRSIGQYHKPPHVRNRFDDGRRPITEALAEEAIAAGTVEPNHIDRQGRTWRYRHRVDGCDVVVGAADATDPYHDHVVLTAFVDIADANTAWASDTWSVDECQAAALLQYLQGDKPVESAGLSPKAIHVEDPIDFGGHRLINKNGYSLAVCIDCKHESNDGHEYKRRGCD